MSCCSIQVRISVVRSKMPTMLPSGLTRSKSEVWRPSTSVVYGTALPSAAVLIAAFDLSMIFQAVAMQKQGKIKSDNILRELMQVDGVATLGAGNMWLARELRARQRQPADLPVVLAHPGEPPVRVLAAVAPRRPPGATRREKDLSTGLIKLLGDLCAGLRAADDQDGAGQELLRVAIVV